MISGYTHTHTHTHTHIPFSLSQISLQDEDVFEVLSLCGEFGLPLLQAYCIEHLGTTLTVESVCPTLIGAHSSMKVSSSSREIGEGIVQKCLAFIETNTRAVFQSDHFTGLPKELLITIISSSKVRT